MSERACKRCGDPIPAGKHPRAIYCSENCRKRYCDETTMRGTCRDCGALLGPRTRGRFERCRPCWLTHVHALADERHRLVARLWNEGVGYREIAQALGLGPNSDPGDYIERAREAGYDLPRRYSPERCRNIREARWGVAA